MRSDVVRQIIGPTYIFKEVEPEADALIDKDTLLYGFFASSAAHH